MKPVLSHKAFVAGRRFVLSHKIVSLVALVLVVSLGWWGIGTFTSTPNAPHYVLGTVTTGTLIASVSASGQVAAESQLDVKPKVSGDVVWIGVKPGDTVTAGQGLLKLDDTNAVKAVADATRSLAAAQLQYQHDTAQAPIDYQNAHASLVTAQDALTTEYTNTYNDISTTYLDLPAAMTTTESTIYGHDLNLTTWNADVIENVFQGDDRTMIDPFVMSAKSGYQSARTAYDAAALAYKGLTRASSRDAVDATLVQTVAVTIDVAQALQSELNFLGTATDLAQTGRYKLPATVTTLQSNARSSLSTVNQSLSTLLAEKKTLDNAKQAITTDQNALTLLSIGNTASGTDPISLQVSANSIQSQEENLANLKQTLAEYLVAAPFGGTVAAVAAQRYASAGSGSAVVTLITRQKMATLSLNEVDVAKIKLGDKVTLTFDAIDGLSLTGSVAELDSLGAVSQGVVSYTVKIGFDTQDTRVKSSMTVNAAIVTDAHQDVLTVPSSAVKTQNGTSYVQQLSSAGAPLSVPVTVGISDDTSTEIVSGLTDGEQIIVRTITTAKPTTSSAPALIGGGGGRGGGGRIGG
jgi:RND family efflux transporter MFP subunit